MPDLLITALAIGGVLVLGFLCPCTPWQRTWRNQRAKGRRAATRKTMQNRIARNRHRRNVMRQHRPVSATSDDATERECARLMSLPCLADQNYLVSPMTDTIHSTDSPGGGESPYRPVTGSLPPVCRPFSETAPAGRRSAPVRRRQSPIPLLQGPVPERDAARTNPPRTTFVSTTTQRT